MDVSDLSLKSACVRQLCRQFVRGTGARHVSSVVAVLAAVSAAACFGGSSALQHLAASREATVAPLDVGLLARLLRSPGWILGQLLSFLGIGAQAVALLLAPILVVQPLLVLGLPIAVMLRAYLVRARASRTDLLISALCAAAVGALVLAITVHENDSHVSNGALVLMTTCIIVVAGVAAASTRIGPTALICGASAGALLGFAAVALRAVTTYVAQPIDPTLAVLVVLMVIAALLGLLLAQTSFQRASIAGPLAALTLAEPLAAVALARPVLGESASLTPVSTVVVVIALAVGIWSVIQLAKASGAVESE